MWKIIKIPMNEIKEDLTNEDIFHVRGFIILRYQFLPNESKDSM